MREFIDRIFQKYLTPRERKILYLYYGLEEGSEAMTLEKIGALMGVTRERIRRYVSGPLKSYGNPRTAGRSRDSGEPPRRRVRRRTPTRTRRRAGCSDEGSGRQFLAPFAYAPLGVSASRASA